MEIPEPFDGLKFFDEMQSVKVQEIVYPFEVLHLPFNEDEINVSGDYNKITRKRKRQKFDDSGCLTLKNSRKIEEKKKHKDKLGLIKTPFKIVNEQYGAESDKNKEIQSPFKQTENNSIKPTNNEEQIPKNERQERNRVCARKCRLRKKMYLQNIEKENRMLKNEIIKYRKELNTYKAKEEAGLLGSLTINTMKSEAIEKLKVRDTVNAKELLNSYMVN